jgi:hypothetical protein
VDIAKDRRQLTKEGTTVGTHDPVITYYQAARIHAQAWYEDPTLGGSKAGGFKDSLEKDPAGALEPKKNDFGILDGANTAKLIDLDLYNQDLGDVDFGDYSPAELQTIFTTGFDAAGIQVKMRPSLWITPSGKITEIGTAPVGISLENWARIYAYIVFMIPKDPTIKANYQIDPARTLDKQIITPLNTASPALPPIIYVRGGLNPTPLITHGDPPPQDPSEPSFRAIANDPNARGYRYIVRFSC